MAAWRSCGGEIFRNRDDLYTGSSSDPDICLRTFQWIADVECKRRDRLPVRDNTPLLVPGSLTEGQRTRLQRLWLMPGPSCVLLFIEPRSWAVIPTPCIPFAEKDPWIKFKGVIQTVPYSRITPAHFLKAFDDCWSLIYGDTSPSLSWGPRMPRSTWVALRRLLDTPGAQHGTLGGPTDRSSDHASDALNYLRGPGGPS